jgi:hypothetical protein
VPRAQTSSGILALFLHRLTAPMAPDTGISEFYSESAGYGKIHTGSWFAENSFLSSANHMLFPQSHLVLTPLPKTVAIIIKVNQAGRLKTEGAIFISVPLERKMSGAVGGDGGRW